MTAIPVDSHSVRVSWEPPPQRHSNGNITYYKIRYVEATRSYLDAVEFKIKEPWLRERVIENLAKWTEYRIWVLAGTAVGDGPPSQPVLVRTDEDGM